MQNQLAVLQPCVEGDKENNIAVSAKIAGIKHNAFSNHSDTLLFITCTQEDMMQQ